MVCAVGIVEMMLPLFNDISGKDLSVGIFDNFYAIPLLAGLSVAVGILAGSYPAVYLSSFIPAQVRAIEIDRAIDLTRNLVLSSHCPS